MVKNNKNRMYIIRLGGGGGVGGYLWVSRKYPESGCHIAAAASRRVNYQANSIGSVPVEAEEEDMLGVLSGGGNTACESIYYYYDYHYIGSEGEDILQLNLIVFFVLNIHPPTPDTHDNITSIIIIKIKI